MTALTKKYALKKKQQCAYKNVCYIAEAMDCFGYKLDCPLYLKSNGEFLDETSFHRAVDSLIDRTKAEHHGLL